MQIILLIMKFSGRIRCNVRHSAGGPYRIDTGLETKSTTPDLTWVYRGDCVLHIGVGNLFIIAGQSNSAGYSRDFCLDPPSMDVHLYRNRSQWDIASHPMNENTYAETCAMKKWEYQEFHPILHLEKNMRKYLICRLDWFDVSWWLPYGSLEPGKWRFVSKYDR